MLSTLKFIKKQSGYKRVHNVFVEVYYLHYTSFKAVHGCLWWAGHAWLAVGKLIPDLSSTWERLIRRMAWNQDLVMLLSWLIL